MKLGRESLDDLSGGAVFLATGGGGDPVCGDGQRQGDELCDGEALAEQECATLGLGFTGGELGCNAACDGFDTSSCTGDGSHCGNNNHASRSSDWS